MTPSRPQSGGVVVTGLGTVNAYGLGPEGLARALVAGEPGPVGIDRAAGYHRPDGARTALLAGHLDLSAHVPASAARRMSFPSRCAIAAARLALVDGGYTAGPVQKTAGAEPVPPGGPGLAVSLATAFGTAAFTERLLREIFGAGPEAASPFLFAESVANAPTAQVAIVCKAQGPNITITQREAGPLLALAQGAAQIRRGRARHVLAGDVDEASPLVHAGLDRFGALAHAPEGEPERGRPFDRDRNGFLLAEGATVVLLESEESARERGAPIRARVAAAWSAFDPSAPQTGWGDRADLLGAALRGGLERAGLEPKDLDLVVSGANGARRGDRLEGLTLRSAWGEVPLPPVVAPKAVCGEYGGGLLASALLVIGGLATGPTPGFANADPELGIVPHDGRALAPPRRILVSALGAGGAAAWVVLERPDQPA